MADLIDFSKLRHLREAETATRQGNAFIALAAKLQESGGNLEDIVKAMLMASACVIVDAAEPDEARRMAQGVSSAYPGMVEILLASRKRGGQPTDQ
ncbi:MAG TPA: hypothetical protein VGD08_04610 [Stellaceae bacterium]|jgi:hypothetical protein